jgi:hypothetical protein
VRNSERHHPDDLVVRSVLNMHVCNDRFVAKMRGR